MRSYGEYCALAKGLDDIGERWTLLIVRELLVRGPCRYTDLRFGLPGIATNLLAERLRELELAGVIRREAAPPPVATTLFHLTKRGEELEPVMRAIGSWGAPLLAEARDDDEFRSHWLALPANYSLVDGRPELPPITIQIHTGDQPMLLEVGGTVSARPGVAEHPDGVLTGPHRLILGVLHGRLDLGQAEARGLRFEGDPEVLSRFRSQFAVV